jgi:hypothetical protein
MTPRSPKTVLTSPRMSQVRVLNPRVRVRVQAESTSGETESASRENGTRVGLESEFRVRVLQICKQLPRQRPQLGYY